MYRESRSEGFLYNDCLGWGFDLLRSLLRSFFEDFGVHWNGRWWSHIGPEIFDKLLQINVKAFSWQVEVVGRRVGVGG